MYLVSEFIHTGFTFSSIHDSRQPVSMCSNRESATDMVLSTQLYASSIIQRGRVRTHSTGEGGCWYGHQWLSTNKLAVGNFEKRNHQSIPPVHAEDNVVWNMKPQPSGLTVTRLSQNMTFISALMRPHGDPHQ